jgi:hypothetical protein
MEGYRRSIRSLDGKENIVSCIKHNVQITTILLEMRIVNIQFRARAFIYSFCRRWYMSHVHRDNVKRAKPKRSLRFAVNTSEKKSPVPNVLARSLAKQRKQDKS